MRYARAALVLFGLMGTAWAADSFVGTWKLNTSKSKYKTGQSSREQTIAIEQQGEYYDVQITGTTADGSPTRSHYTIPAAGGPGRVHESAGYDAVSSKRLGGNTREIAYFKGGRQVLTVRVSTAKDGRTLTVRLKGADAQGKLVEGTAVYDRH